MLEKIELIIAGVGRLTMECNQQPAHLHACLWIEVIADASHLFCPGCGAKIEKDFLYPLRPQPQARSIHNTY